jgi:hypothetical protein
MSVNAEHEKNEQDFLDAQKADELLAKIKAQALDLNLEEEVIAYNLVNDETPARKNDQVIIGQENRVQK